MHASPASTPTSGCPGHAWKPVEPDPSVSPVLVEPEDEELPSVVPVFVVPLELDSDPDDDSLEVVFVVVVPVVVVGVDSVVAVVDVDGSSSIVVPELPDSVSPSPTTGVQPRLNESRDSRSEDAIGSS